MPAVTPAPPPPVDEPIWEIRLASVNPDFSPGPYRLSDIRRMVIEGRLQDNDLARVMEGDWEPIRSYPAVNNFFSEKVQIEREVHGDEDHCAVHRDQSAGWQCPKCRQLPLQGLRREPARHRGGRRQLRLRRVRGRRHRPQGQEPPQEPREPV